MLSWAMVVAKRRVTWRSWQRVGQFCGPAWMASNGRGGTATCMTGSPAKATTATRRLRGGHEPAVGTSRCQRVGRVRPMQHRPADARGPLGRRHTSGAGRCADRGWRLRLPPEINRYWDFRIWLDIDPELAVQRGVRRDEVWAGEDVEALHRDRYQAAEGVYVAEVDPASQVHIAIDNARFDNPRSCGSGLTPGYRCHATRGSAETTETDGRSPEIGHACPIRVIMSLDHVA
jgi:hypothetical protein